MAEDELKEKRDIEMLRKKYPLRDITEVAYDKDEKLFAMATRNPPESTKIDTGQWFGEGYFDNSAPGL